MRPSDPGQRVKGVHSDRRPGVCCDGVNQTYPVPLRAIGAHGLTEVIARSGGHCPHYRPVEYPYSYPLQGKQYVIRVHRYEIKVLKSAEILTNFVRKHIMR